MVKYRIIPIPDLKWSVEISNEVGGWSPVLDYTRCITLNTGRVTYPARKEYATKLSAKAWIQSKLNDEAHLTISPEIYP